MPPVVNQWKCVIRTYFRLQNMSNDRINNKVFRWMCDKSNRNCKNWYFRTTKQLERLNLYVEDRNAVNLIEEMMLEIFKNDWKMKVSSDQGTRPSQSNKVRTYRLFKEMLNLSCQEITEVPWQNSDAE